MSLRHSFLSTKISHRSFSLSKSFKEFKSPDTRNSFNYNNKEEIETAENENDRVVGKSGLDNSDFWAGMLPELLGEIIQKVEMSEEQWPQRQNVVACGCVCKQWRKATKDVVRKASINRQDAKITFPSCLKKPGPLESPRQCLIKRDKKNATFYLYLALSPLIIGKVIEFQKALENYDVRRDAEVSLDIQLISDYKATRISYTYSFMDEGKFLLAARRYRNGTHIEYIISLDANDLSQGSNAYIGKLRSDFLGTNFSIYDSQPPHSRAKPSSSRAGRRFASKQISPQVPAGNFEIGQVSYKFNLLKSRGPRRMACSLKYQMSEEMAADKSQDDLKIKKSESSNLGYAVLKNKAPRWHEHLECWCLNFHGRVTVASVKNFQLVATIDQSQPGGKGDEEKVVLQFGKVDGDTFTMDYMQPLSAFQAFAICLTSFGTKLACE